MLDGAEPPHLLEGQDYYPEDYHREGFIHGAYASQLSDVLKRYFANSLSVVVLELDKSLLAARVVDENTSGGTELFPHIYGPIRKNALRHVHVLHRKQDSMFRVGEVIGLNE